MTTLYLLASLLLGLLALPLLLYVCIKMGTLGYLQARYRFDQLTKLPIKEREKTA